MQIISNIYPSFVKFHCQIIINTNLLKKYYNFFYERYTGENRSEFFWFAAGYVINFIMGFVIIKILSNLGTDEYGKYALIITIANFFGFFYTYNGTKNFDKFIKVETNLFKVVISAVIVLTLALTPLADFFSLSVSFIILTGLFIISFKINESTLTLLNILRKRKLNSVILILEKIVLISSFALFLLNGKLDLINTLIIFNIFYLLFAFLRISYYKKNVSNNYEIEKPLSKQEIKKEIYAYVLPFIVWGQASWLQLNGEKWIIADILSTSDVGIYAVMISLVNALISIPGNYISEFLAPIIFKNFSDLNNKENVNIGINYIKINIAVIAVLTVCVTLFMFFFGYEMIIIISSRSFASYSYLLPLLSLGVGLFNIGQAMTTLGLGFNKPKIYLAPKLIVGVLSLAANIFFVLWFGIDGIAYSSLLIGIFYITATYLANKIKLLNPNNV